MANVRAVVLWVGRSSKRVAVSAIGFTLVAAGVVMIVTPGPGALAVIAGFAVLATEYAWAQRALETAKRRAGQARRRVSRRPPG